MIDTMTYKFKGATRKRGLDPEVVGAMFKKIENEHGGLTAELVVQAAKPKRSYIHDFFEWDDEKAGEVYRLEQARYLIRHIIIEVVGERETPRAFITVVKGTPSQKVYLDTIQIMATPELRLQVLAMFLSELNVLRRRYAELLKFSNISEPFEALEEAVKQHGTQSKCPR